MPFYNVQCWAEQIFACGWWLGWMWLCYSLNEFILLFEFSIFSFGFELNSCITLAFNLILPIGPWAEWLALNSFGLVLYIEDVVSDLFANDKHFSFTMKITDTKLLAKTLKMNFHRMVECPVPGNQKCSIRLL